MHTIFIKLLLLLLFVPGLFAARPNIVFILADDLGWSDSTLYGTTDFYQTPNLERLAKSGMTFTRAYAASPLCSPTRASILTGLNPARIGITAPNCHTPEVLLKPSVSSKAAPHVKTLVCKSVTRFDTHYYTLAERLKAEGYATAHFGKWHLGPEPYSPLEHGFDVDIPHWHGPGPAGSFVAPWKFSTFKEKVPQEHIEDRMADEAVAFIEAHKDEPFFLNYWQFSVHAPFDAKVSLVKKYKKLADPNDAQRSPTYAAMVESMDDGVGTLLDALDRLGLAENTLVIFFSDNGGNTYNTVDETAPTSNDPLRGGKATMYEGGIRVPCVVRWPGHVKPASRSDAVIQSVDFYPTILEMLDLKPADDQAFDGVSIVPALRGQALDREALYTYFPHHPGVPDNLPPSVSVHQGDWKLIRLFYDVDSQTHGYRLYNLKDDIGEQHNLAAAFPERVQQMDALLDQFLSDTRAVLPKPNPAYDPNHSKASVNMARESAGWKVNSQVELAFNEGSMILTSTGNDPHLSYAFTRPFGAGDFVWEVELLSDVGGQGQLFWLEQGGHPGFARERSKSFSIQKDATGQTLRVSFSTTQPLRALRFDPSRAKGLVRVSSMKLSKGGGTLLHRWSFK
ncbi:MAG: arylsulfatase A-like enzyme [Verrucomicrobiales bacterium]|jgi:arylsulfatase A-like enzyme